MLALVLDPILGGGLAIKMVLSWPKLGPRCINLAPQDELKLEPILGRVLGLQNEPQTPQGGPKMDLRWS